LGVSSYGRKSGVGGANAMSRLLAILHVDCNGSVEAIFVIVLANNNGSSDE
jgi:hypothetical protein